MQVVHSRRIIHAYTFVHLIYVAFNLATKAINAGLNNQRIFTEIDRINQKVDELVFSIAQLDIKFATLLRNSSVAIGVRWCLCFKSYLGF